MLHIDVNYSNRLSPYLRNYKYLGNYRWNFSCPFCGDSKKNPRAARGNIFEYKGALKYKCFNCQKSTNIYKLIEQVDSNLLKEYKFDNYKSYSYKEKLNTLKDEPLVEIVSDKSYKELFLSNCKSFMELQDYHPAVKYVESRKIPKECWDRLYYTPKYKQFTNILKMTYPNIILDEPRLLIPYFDNNSELFMFTARSFSSKSKNKYVHTKLIESAERVYGIDRIDTSKKIYVVEGQIDSLFLPNCISMSGSSFDCDFVNNTDRTNIVLVYDNEPKSEELTSFMEESIDKGFNVVIWPDNISQKDINEMVLAGYSKEEILDIINKNTYNGLTAKAKLAFWRK